MARQDQGRATAPDRQALTGALGVWGAQNQSPEDSVPAGPLSYTEWVVWDSIVRLGVRVVEVPGPVFPSDYESGFASSSPFRHSPPVTSVS